VNVAVVAPAATVTVAGTVPADVRLDDKLTTNPPVGAALEMVTVPVDGVPPITDVGFIERALSTGAVIDSGAVAVAPYAAALIFAVWFVATATVDTVKVPELEPAGIVRDAGTVPAPLSDDNWIW